MPYTQLLFRDEAGIVDPTPPPAALTPSRRWRTGPTLYRYVARELLLPTAFAVAVLTLVVLTKDLLGWTDLIINRGLGVGPVSRIAAYEAIPQLTRVLPFAAMMGALMALGRLAGDHELLALETSGASATDVLRPILAISALTTGVALFFSLVAAPWAVRSLDTDLADISLHTPAAAIQAGQVHHFGDWKLEAREVSARGDRMRGVMLWMPSVGETVFAERGALDPDPEAASTRITLEQGTVVLHPRHGASMLRFDRMTTLLPGTDQPITRENADDLGGATLAELLAAEDGSPPASAAPGEAPGIPPPPSRARIELHRRLALPLATLIFGALSLPLLVARARSSRAAGGVLGILTTIAYYALLQLGSGLIEEGRVGPALGVWLPDLITAALAVVLAARMTRLLTYGRPPARRLPRLRLRHLIRARPENGLHPRRWPLQRYLAGHFLGMAALCFFGLLTAYFLVDLLERLDFFARYGASRGEVIRYYAAHVPLLASRVFPMSLLLAMALTASLLGARNELTAMRACGISPPRSLLVLLGLCLLLVPVDFALDNELVPRANAIADYLKNVEIRGREAERRERANVWYRVRNRLFSAELLDPELGFARRLTIDELGPDGLPVRRTEAREAHYIGGGLWRLIAPLSVEIGPDRIRRVPAPTSAELDAAVPTELHTKQLSLGELRAEIREVEESGYDATPYRVDLYARRAAPLACLVLPALALFFALGGPPFPSPPLTLLFSMGVAVTHILLTGVGASLGYGGALPPPVAGLAPTGLLVLVVLGLLLRVPGVRGRL